MNTTRFIFILGIIAASVAAFIPALASAATMGIVSESPSVVVGQPFEVDVTLDTQGVAANAVQATVTFPAGQFTLQGVNDGASPVSLWIEPPHETASGSVEFAGIVPGGVSVASSVVGLILVPTAPGAGAIRVSNVSLLANDGEGSPIPVTTSDATIDVAPAPASGVVPQGPSFSYTVPHTFTPVISQDPGVYNGEYFLIFSTTDKGSGMAYYQVLETPAGVGMGQGPAWVTASSPYLLQDQTLSSDIYVRAVNNAGNAIVVKVPARHAASPWRGAWEAAIAAVIGVFVIAAAWFFRRRRHRP
jgi:hypothetical protein